MSNSRTSKSTKTKAKKKQTKKKKKKISKRKPMTPKIRETLEKLKEKRRAEKNSRKGVKGEVTSKVAEPTLAFSVFGNEFDLDAFYGDPEESYKRQDRQPLPER